MGAAVDLKDIKAIIDLMKKNDLSVFEMEKDGFRLKLQKGVDQPIISAPATVSPSPTPAESSRKLWPRVANRCSSVRSSSVCVDAQGRSAASSRLQLHSCSRKS